MNHQDMKKFAMMQPRLTEAEVSLLVRARSHRPVIWEIRNWAWRTHASDSALTRAEKVEVVEKLVIRENYAVHSIVEALKYIGDRGDTAN